MRCSCGNAACGCRDECHCCPYVCYCPQCVSLRRRMRVHHHPCHACGSRGICGHHHESTAPQSDAQQSRRRPPGDKISMGRPIIKTTHGPLTASQRCVPESSHSDPKESSKFDESLIFQMDDIDTSPEVPTNTSSVTSTRTKNRDFHGSSEFRSNANVSGTKPLQQRELTNRVRRYSHQSTAARRYKSKKSNECKQLSTVLEKPDITSLAGRGSQESKGTMTTPNISECLHHNPDIGTSKIEESRVKGLPPPQPTLCVTDLNRDKLLEREIPTTSQDVPSCSFHNPNTNISKQVTEISSEHKLDETRLKCTGSYESEMITEDIPGCSYHYKCVSKQDEFQAAGSASYAIPQSEDEYASDSLPSLPSSLSSDDSSTSSSSDFARSPTRLLSTSAPAIYDLPEYKELTSSEQETSTMIGTSKLSPRSNFDALKLSDSHPVNKQRTSSESSSSIEILPENTPNEAKYDSFHGQPGIPSISIAPSQLINSEMQGVSSEQGTSQMLPASNLLKSESPKVSVPVRRIRSSESESSIETPSREKN